MYLIKRIIFNVLVHCVIDELNNNLKPGLMSEKNNNRNHNFN